MAILIEAGDYRKKFPPKKSSARNTFLWARRKGLRTLLQYKDPKFSPNDEGWVIWASYPGDPVPKNNTAPFTYMLIYFDERGRYVSATRKMRGFKDINIAGTVAPSAAIEKFVTWRKSELAGMRSGEKPVRGAPLQKTEGGDADFKAFAAKASGADPDSFIDPVELQSENKDWSLNPA